jgi:NAD(P)-dependent dehydrogenase (short-subunit alcohol dehydrogenase family)
MADVIVWITGASSGIGAALVETLPFDDARVFDVSRSGGTPATEHVRADLADPASWATVEEHLRAELDSFGGSRAVFVHCAGTLQPMGFAGEVDGEDYRRAVLLNCAAPQALGQSFLAASAALSCARELVLISSGAAASIYEGWSSYCAGKAAVDQWTRVAAAEQRRRSHCRVFAVNPGPVATGMQDLIRAMDEHDFPAVEKFRELHASGRMNGPLEVADAIWRLLDGDVEPGEVVDVREWL